MQVTYSPRSLEREEARFNPAQTQSPELAFGHSACRSRRALLPTEAPVSALALLRKAWEHGSLRAGIVLFHKRKPHLQRDWRLAGESRPIRSCNQVVVIQTRMSISTPLSRLF